MVVIGRLPSPALSRPQGAKLSRSARLGSIRWQAFALLGREGSKLQA